MTYGIKANTELPAAKAAAAFQKNAAQRAIQKARLQLRKKISDTTLGYRNQKAFLKSLGHDYVK
jgi:hypothetical protein